MALMCDGTVCCWGVLNQGGDRGTSVIMRGPSGITAIAAAGASNFSGYCAAASASGEVFAWAGTDHSYMPPAVQMRVRGRPRAGRGLYRTLGPFFVVTDDGTLWSWGTNSQGQLGAGRPYNAPGRGRGRRPPGDRRRRLRVVLGRGARQVRGRVGVGHLRVRPPDEPRDAAEDAVARARPRAQPQRRHVREDASRLKSDKFLHTV